MTTGVLPSFITYTQIGLTINPIVITDVNVYTIKVTITDTHSNPSYTFVLTVTNKAPIVTSAIPEDIIILFGIEFIYTLPTS